MIFNEKYLLLYLSPTAMNKALIAAGIAVAIVIAIAGAYVSLTEPAPEGAIESTTPQPTETTTQQPPEPITQQTDEQPAVPTIQNITVRIDEYFGFRETP